MNQRRALSLREKNFGFQFHQQLPASITLSLPNTPFSIVSDLDYHHIMIGSNKPNITQLTTQYRNGSLSPVDVAKQELDKMKRVNRRVNPFVHIFEEKEIIQKAQESAERYKKYLHIVILFFFICI